MNDRLFLSDNVLRLGRAETNIFWNLLNEGELLTPAALQFLLIKQ